MQKEKQAKKIRNKQLEFLNSLRRPTGFAKHLLGLTLYDWQTKVLRDIEPVNARVALRAANGSGKTNTQIRKHANTQARKTANTQTSTKTGKHANTQTHKHTNPLS